MAPSTTSSTSRKTRSSGNASLLRQSKLSEAFNAAKRSSSLSNAPIRKNSKKTQTNPRRSVSVQDTTTRTTSSPSSSIISTKLEPEIIEDSADEDEEYRDKEDDNDGDDEDEDEDEGSHTVFRAINSTPKRKAKLQAATSTKKEAKAEVKVERESLKELVKKGVLKDQYAYARAQMAGLDPIHGQNETQVHSILRVFDLSYQYGPCVGVTRMERWNRAKALGLDPPEEVKRILETQEAVEKDEYKQPVLYRYDSEGTYSVGL